MGSESMFNSNNIDCTIDTDNPAGHVQKGAGDNDMDEDEYGGDANHSLTKGQSTHHPQTPPPSPSL